VISGEVAEAFEKIVANAKKVDALVAEIANGSNEQGHGIGQLNSAVAAMDKVTQDNAATAEESAKSARDLESHAKTLRGAVIELHALFNVPPETTAAPSDSAVPRNSRTPGPRRAAASPNAPGRPRVLTSR